MRFAAVFLIALSFWLPTSLAFGQPAAESATPEQATSDPRQQAHQLALKGIKLFEARDYEGAIAHLEQAELKFHAPSHLLFMARAHHKLGHLQAAYALFVQLAIEPLPQYAPKAFLKAQQTARARVAELRSKITGVMITVSGVALELATVRINGRKIENRKLIYPVPLPAGEHRISASAEQMTTATTKITVTSNPGPQTVNLELRPVPLPPPEPPPLPLPPPEQEQAGSLVPAITAFGVGAAALAVGFITGGIAFAKANDIKEHCDGNICPAHQQSEVDSVADIAMASNISFIVAGVAATAGVVLLILRPGGDSSTTHNGSRGLALGAVLGPGSLKFVGRF